jgi:hypothetical protein
MEGIFFIKTNERLKKKDIFETLLLKISTEEPAVLSRKKST